MQIGPHPWIWRWKQRIDRQFMNRFDQAPAMESEAMDCRGCAAKLPAAPLEAALEAAGLKSLGTAPEDAASLGKDWLQSVDGFPALISDPWLNGRLTALHASSDLWACGASVDSAMAVITLPKTAAALQQELLSQTLSGLRSAFEPEGARLIGGHTLEARSEAPTPLSLGLQVSLSVNGKRPSHPWRKGGLRAGDQLLLSRPLGTGVLFAAAMAGATQPEHLDHALAQMGTSQHPIVEQLQALISLEPEALSSCTDVTGFGLLGHLGEMLQASSHTLQVVLNTSAIPALPGALKLLKAQYASSLAPANRRAWSLLDPSQDQAAKVILARAGSVFDPKDDQAMLELLVDPQTCGPLLLGCSEAMAEALLQANDTAWHRIGVVSASRADAAGASAAIPLRALGPAANPGPRDH
jgi:selenide,water dikinase